MTKIGRLDQETKPNDMQYREIHLIQKVIHKLKVKELKTIFHAIRTRRKVGGVTLISDKEDFKSELNRRGKEGNYILVKGTIQQEEITTINTHASNTDVPNLIKQIPLAHKTCYNT